MNPDRLDDFTWAIYLEIPESMVVLLQVFFETYEGLGTVRTLDIKKSLVCVLTTSSLLEECLEALRSMRGVVPWRMCTETADASRLVYNFKKAGH